MTGINRWISLAILSDGEPAGVYMRRFRLLDSRRLGIKIHQICRSDQSELFHDHPWSFVSLTLSRRRYTQIRLDESALQTVDRSRVRRVHATERHRIDVSGGRPCWTLVIHGPRNNEWRFYDRAGHEVRRSERDLIVNLDLPTWLKRLAATGRLPTAALPNLERESVRLGRGSRTTSDALSRLRVGADQRANPNGRWRHAAKIAAGYTAGRDPSPVEPRTRPDARCTDSR
jgi:hypothetical protein